MLSDSELVGVAVAQVLLGYHSEARWLRYVRKHLSGMFPYLPRRAGYIKRLLAILPLVKRIIREPARNSGFWTATVWITDSAPVPCGMSRPTVRRSNLAAGPATAAARLPLPVLLGPAPVPGVHPTGMPILWALANPELDERAALTAMLEVDAELVARRTGTLLIAGKLVFAMAHSLRRSVPAEPAHEPSGTLRHLLEDVADGLACGRCPDLDEPFRAEQPSEDGGRKTNQHPHHGSKPARSRYL